MITKITRKEFLQIQEQRKMRPKLGFLVFKAPNGKYYKTDSSGMKGTEEMTKWNKKIQKQMEAQIGLF